MSQNVAIEPEVWNPEWDHEVVDDEFDGFSRLALWERTHPREVAEILENVRLKREGKKIKSSI